MTEHDDPTNADSTDDNARADSDRPSDEDAAWFRAHVDPVVGGDVADAWDEIRSRASGRQRMLIPLPTAPAKAWPGRRLVAVAALLLVTVAVIGLGLKLVGSDDGDERPASDDGATGFYVPGELPPGWELTGLNVESKPGETAILDCPCDVTEVSNDDGEAAYVAVSSNDSPSEYEGADSSPIESNDRSGSYVDEGDTRTVVWRTAGGSRAVISTSLGRTELEELAEAWTSDAPPVLDEHHVTGTWHRDQPIETGHSVRWTFTNLGAGQNIFVSMDPGIVPVGNLVAPPTITLPGNGLPLSVLQEDPDGVSAVASWPGTTEIFAMSLSAMAFNDEVQEDDLVTPPAGLATVEAILGSFQPADAATWSAHVESTPVDDAALDPDAEPQDLAVLQTDRISDWLAGPEPGTPLPKPSVQVIHDHPDAPTAAITVESDVDQVDVVAGERFTIELTMTNRTGATVDLANRSGGAFGGCPFGSVTWSVVDENGLVANAGGVAVDCGSNPDPWPDGEQRTQTFDFPGWGPMPDEGPIAAVIDFGHVTVVVPGEVGG